MDGVSRNQHELASLLFRAVLFWQRISVANRSGSLYCCWPETQRDGQTNRHEKEMKGDEKADHSVHVCLERRKEKGGWTDGVDEL